MSSFWLTKRKKAELVDFCQKLGLDYDGYLKSDLESILSEYLDTHESELGTDSVFSGYYESQARSPYKKSSSALPFNAQGELTELPEKRSRRRTSRFVAGETTSNESTPEPVIASIERKTRAGSRALATRTPRTVRTLHDAAAVPLPPSPAAVADEIESRANALVASAKQSLADAELHQKAISVRDRLSNVVSVNAVSLAIEALLLITALIPLSYIVSVPAVAALGVKEPTRLVLPDLFVLLTSGFWSPVLTWLATSILVPAANAAVFNLVATTVGPKASKDEDWYQVDPLSFAVTKALVAYLVHYKGFSFGGLLGDQTVGFVGTAVGKELQLVGAGIGGLAAIWEGILRK